MSSTRPSGRAAGAAEWLVGGGEMGALMRALDWSRTPLGPAARWPQSLRSAVSILLPSRAQIVLFWGPDLVALYNDAYRPVFGAKHPSALGQPARECWREVWDVLEPLFQGVMRTGEAFWARDHLFYLQRHGYPEETYFDVSYDPVRDESGGVGGVFCIVSETTGRVLGERRLATLRELGAATALKSEDEVCHQAAAVLARNPADVPFALFFLRDESREVARLVDAVGVASDAVTVAEIDLTSATPAAAALGAGAAAEVSPDAFVVSLPPAASPDRVLVLPLVSAGEPVGHLVAGVSPYLALGGHYQDFFGLVADRVSTALAGVRAYEAQRRRAEALADLDRAKTAFFSHVSHEFRTPLTLLLGPVTDLLARPAERLPSEDRELLTVVQRNGLRLQRLVNMLLDFSRIEAGRVQAVYEPTDLCAFTAELASSFRSACERAGLRLVTDCVPVEAPVYVDHDMWEKIVLNLVSNAFKFTFEGEIAVTVRPAPDAVQLVVRDTGIGIPPEAIPHLFERFHRVAGARGRTHEGTGIGLALVHELVKLHGGVMRVESVRDVGSTFIVSIPTGTAHLPPDRIGGARTVTSTALGVGPYVEEALRWLPDAGSTRFPRTSPSGGPEGAARQARVLWAEDNADLREYVRRLLGAHYDVEAVADGSAALAAARARRPDLVLADVMMPVLDGFELLRGLRAHDETRTVPIILLSARAGEESRVEGLEAGADDYLVKPFSARELLARVAALLQMAELRRDTERTLREADRAKDEFLAMLGHELRNPLGAISSAVRLLGDVARQDATAARAQSVIERQTGHLARLVDDLLDVARVTTGNITLSRRPVELAGFVETVVSAWRHSERLDRHRVSVTGGPAWVEADETRLEQIVSNLLGNAVKFTPAGGAVAVRVRADRAEAVLEVEDTGVGIPAELIDRVFDLFVQGDRSVERTQGGLGIGLTLVRRLVERHGGRVTVRSGGPGEGSLFTVRLPAIAPPSRRMAPAPQHGAEPRRILLVEDNDDAREMLRFALAREGHTVLEAASGHEGIELATSATPDIALIDLGLPGRDGYEVARTIRAALGRDITLIALTGYGSPDDRRRTEHAGFDAHLVKPLDPVRLSALLAGTPRRRG